MRPPPGKPLNSSRRQADVQHDGADSFTLGRAADRTAPTPPADRVRSLLRPEGPLNTRRKPQAMARPSREDRVAALRELVARGAYRVTSERIAEAMLEDQRIAFVLGLSRGR